MNADHFQKRAKHRLVVVTIVVCVVGATYWYFSNYFSLSEVTLIGNFVEQFAETEAAKTFLAPPPIISTSTSVKRGAPPLAGLTIEGVITDTNAERASSTLSPLAESQLLDDVATLRMEDMFTNQYFAHVSPTGESAITVASTVGYSYLALGENLALGNFAGDEGVVTAWMASPGHRANILDPHYTQIGVAVGKGTYQNKSTWIAVQVFGRPASDCPAPDATVKAAVDAGEGQLNQMAVQLSNDDAAISSANPKYGPDYNNDVATYNALVQQYNTLAAQVKTETTQYDAEVQAFNTCLGQ